MTAGVGRVEGRFCIHSVVRRRRQRGEILRYNEKRADIDAPPPPYLLLSAG